MLWFNFIQLWSKFYFPLFWGVVMYVNESKAMMMQLSRNIYSIFLPFSLSQSGLSRELFEQWCTDRRNGVIIAGYCVEGTLAKVKAC